jgi:hypothetical protein
MERLFTFGCSFTNYKWPTWADILGRGYTDFQNWGRGGGGNSFIFNSLIECHVRNTIAKDDTVCIMWTNVSREDRYVNDHWITPGNIYTQATYDEQFVKKFADVRGYYIRDLALIYAAQQLLQKIGCKYFFLSMVPIDNPNQYYIDTAVDNIKDIVPYYKLVIDEIRPSVYEIVFNNDWWSRLFNPQPTDDVENMYSANAGQDWPTWQQFINKQFNGIKKDILQEIFNTDRWNWGELLHKKRRVDPHPTPNEHLEYLMKVVPELAIDSDAVNWANQIDELLRQKKNYDHLWQSQKVTRW